MILVTGAAGKTGHAVIRALVGKQQIVRGLVYRKEQVVPIRKLGVQSVAVGDMRVQAVMDGAFADVRAVYHIAPNMHAEESGIGQAAIKAGRAAGVAHFVYHSALHPQTEAMPHHWQKLRVEEQLFESGLSCTILQPAAYMQNIQACWSDIQQRGVYPVPYSAETRLSMVDLQDVAEVAAKVLTEPGHEDAIYELSGPEALSPNAAAEILQQQLGRAVRAEVIPVNEWQKQALAAGLDHYKTETLMKMFKYYEQHEFRGNPAVLRWLLKREPTTFAEFVARKLKA